MEKTALSPITQAESSIGNNNVILPAICGAELSWSLRRFKTLFRGYGRPEMLETQVRLATPASRAMAMSSPTAEGWRASLRIYPRNAMLNVRPLTIALHRVGHTKPHLGRRSIATMAQRRITNPALFVCDLQEKFRPAIHGFPKVIATTQKLLRASQILNIPVFATTQNKARLGETCPELGLDSPGGIQTVVHADKTLFSMLTPEVRAGIASLNARLSCVIVGIESHICVTQTALDLISEGHKVYVIADGVSSCNKEEVPIALARLRQEGAVVTSSESFLYECMGDAALPEFKNIINVVKDANQTTKEVLQTLCKM
ncbi:Isochorismatase hydrolase [Massarina eburnea CBS 473.64]|uniref:Isochorismatase hydrolase n=1 Tax=Massarina eburnea CBS 473.64 TaxID=1395130 RepID=A0A6A6RUU6_9PLEO|nr:Isochorismatase hydrolase [Massarina eburnea CBS 473.64]